MSKSQWYSAKHGNLAGVRIRWAGFSQILMTFSAVLLLLSIGCGGGSSGTGTRTIEGSVSGSSGAAIANVKVTIVQTDDVTFTDQNGEFSIETSLIAGDVNLRLQGDEIDTTVTVPDVSGEPTTVSVTISVAATGEPVSITNLEVLTKIVGRCDIYFENLRTIRQSNEVPRGLSCVARTEVKGDGKTLGNVGVTIQVRRCPAGSPWTTLASGVTMSGTNSGVAQVEFPFSDSAETCVYRVVAPDSIAGVKPIVYEIHTFTKQAFDARE